MTKLLAAISATFPSMGAALGGRTKRAIAMTAIVTAYFAVPLAFAAWMLARH